jgi:PBSX family phage terminase large subunit
LRGASFKYCYGDEVADWSQDVFELLKSRLDKPYSVFDGTFNPKAPQHWLKKFLDSDADIFSQTYSIDDNPFLDPSFVENLKREYKGTVLFDRYILGNWVAAEGAIYRTFCDNPESFMAEPSLLDMTQPNHLDIVKANIGVDFGGGTSAHAFNCTAFTRGLREIITVHDYRRKDAATPDLLYADFANFLQECRLMLPKTCVLTDIYCDSAEQTLIGGMDVYARKNTLKVNILNAKKKPINDRIRFYTLIMGAGRYKILRSCAATIDALSSAVWDSKHKTEDVRLDDGSTNIDNLDAQEYSTEPYMSDIIPR